MSKEAYDLLRVFTSRVILKYNEINFNQFYKAYGKTYKITLTRDKVKEWLIDEDHSIIKETDFLGDTTTVRFFRT